MSYCRWSSDNWLCDLYCYEHVDGGWTTHVAGLKRVGPIPNDPTVDLYEDRISDIEWECRHAIHMAAVESAALVPIGLQFDGETFSDPTLEAFRARLLALRAAGYRFPDYVLESVEEEMSSETNE